MSGNIGTLIGQMVAWDAGSHARIAHNLQVYAYADAIAAAEQVDARTAQVVAAAAVVHDAGIRPALEKYRSSAGRYQEMEGPEPAGRMLTAAGYDDEVVQRVQDLVAHHHTYSPVLGQDHQILLEADLLVNMEEKDPVSRQGAAPSIIVTKTGRQLYNQLFGHAEE